jgi:thiol-disulfide isomerase/thioredoxin
MTVVFLVARLLLAAVFAVAGAAKLADRSGTRRALRAFGVPAQLVGTAAIALPLAELTVAALLLPSSTAVAGALGALALLAVFTTAIVINLLRGRAPECRCFGQLHATPTSWRTVGRNTGLLALAVVALAGAVAAEPASAVVWIAGLGAGELVAAAAAGLGLALLAVGALALVKLVGSYGHVLTRLERLEAALVAAGLQVDAEDVAARVGREPGTEAPWFLATTPAGTGVSRDDLLEPGLPVLLLFTSPHCGPCAELLPDAARWQEAHAGELTVAFASAGAAQAVDAEAAEFGLGRVLVDEDATVAASFEAPGTPAAVLIGADGTIASWVATGRDEIAALVERATTASDHGAGLPIGIAAPSLELPSLEGPMVSLAELRGRDTLLLFWNPGCGYCRSMHDDVRAWEGSANGVTPRLVVVSSGEADETRAEGFASTVLLDSEYAAGSAFGAGGTPMAVLLDADGRVASPVVAGAEAVLELAGRPVERVAAAG